MSSHLVDVSLTGAFVAAPLPMGSKIDLEFGMGDHIIRSSAVVVRLQEPSWLFPAGVGVAFDDMDDQSRLALMSVVAELPEDGRGPTN